MAVNSVGGFSIDILSNGRRVSMVGSYYALNDKDEFQIMLENRRMSDCDADVTINEEYVGTWRIFANSSVVVNLDHKLRFSNKYETFDIKVTFIPERTYFGCKHRAEVWARGSNPFVTGRFEEKYFEEKYLEPIVDIDEIYIRTLGVQIVDINNPPKERSKYRYLINDDPLSKFFPVYAYQIHKFT
jgi:hypothetical protein